MLETKFIKVAQSGPTVDGREIEAQDLRDMAETYDPKTYEAVIWPEHERFWGNHGTVLATEARENGDVTELYAKLKPGMRFIQKNFDGQKLYSSIEIQSNFAGTGKAYLSGIAITDTPASLGTEQIKFFSQQRTQHGETLGEFYCSGFELPGLFCNETEGEEEKQEKLLKRLLSRIFSSQQPIPPHTNNEEEMTEQQFKELLGATQANTTATTELVGQFSKVVELISDKFSQGSGDDEDPKKGTEPETTPENTELSALTDLVTKLSTTVDGMNKKFNAALPGTDVPDTTNPADDAGLI